MSYGSVFFDSRGVDIKESFSPTFVIDHFVTTAKTGSKAYSYDASIFSTIEAILLTQVYGNKVSVYTEGSSVKWNNENGISLDIYVVLRTG